MDHTDHHLLVGKGAQDFARSMGFKIEDDLNTEKSRALWLEWKRRIDPLHYLDPKKRVAGRRTAAGLQMVARGADRSGSLLRHDQLRRHQRKGRDLRRHDDERPGVEDSRARRRLADSRRRAVRRRRGRRGRLDRPRRSEPLQPLLVLDRRGNAPRRAPERRGDGGAEARREEHRREAAAEFDGTSRTSG